MPKTIKIISILTGSLFVLWAAYYLAFNLELLSGYPKGVDVYAHLFRVRHLVDYFPQINLNPYWNSGTPYWIFSYPPFSFFPSFLLVKLGGLTPEAALNGVATFHLAVFFVGLFIACYILSENFWISLGLAVLAALTPATWSWWGHGGNYVRLFGMGWWALTLVFLFLNLRTNSRVSYFLFLVFCFLTFGTHFIFVNLLSVLIVLTVIFALPGIKAKIKALFKYLVTPLLLTSYWLVPMFIKSGGKSRFIQGAFAKPVLFGDFLQINPEFPYFTLSFLVSGVVIAAVVIFFVRWITKKFPANSWGISLALGIITLVQLGYLVLGNLPNWPEQGYLAVITPTVSLPILIVHGFLFVASVVRGLDKKIWKFIWPVVGLSLVTGSFVFIQQHLPFPANGLYDVTADYMHSASQSLVKNATLTPNYRFGTDSAYISDWFNYLYPNIPQTRDYIYQGIPYKNWQFYQEATIWTKDNSYRETNWLLDWYGIKYFTLGLASAETKYAKFLNRPDLYTTVAGGEGLFLIQNNAAQPILSQSTAKTILIFSSEQSYENLVRAIALTGLGSHQLVPVWAKSSFADFAESELAKFDLLVFYSYQLNQADLQKLTTYVRSGGRVWFDNNQNLTADGNYPDPIPFAAASAGVRKNTWNFSGELLTDLDANQFSPANYQNYPWKIRIAKNIKSWAKPVLLSADETIMISGTLGSGMVFWSGINFPYHVVSYANEKEADLLAHIIGNLVGELEPGQNQELVWSLYTPENRSLELKGGERGILLKESWFSNWQADISGKKINIYRAGPNLMYLPTAGAKGILHLKYTLNWQEWLGIGLTTILVILVIYYLVFDKIPFFRTKSKNLTGSLVNWWEKDNY